MATKHPNTPQATQISAVSVAAPLVPVATQVPTTAAPHHLTFELPSSITVKDLVVVATALITVVSSWTFYTMRLSVLDQRITDVKTSLEKTQADLATTNKDVQDLKLREEAVEIRLQYKK